MYESMLNLLFFVLFVCFLALILVSIASLDLKVPYVSCEKEEVMSFDVVKQATRGRACSTEKQMVTCSGLSSFVAYLSGLEKPLLAWCKRTAISFNATSQQQVAQTNYWIYGMSFLSTTKLSKERLC